MNLRILGAKIQKRQNGGLSILSFWLSIQSKG